MVRTDARTLLVVVAILLAPFMARGGPREDARHADYDVDAAGDARVKAAEAALGAARQSYARESEKLADTLEAVASTYSSVALMAATLDERARLLARAVATTQERIEVERLGHRATREVEARRELVNVYWQAHDYAAVRRTIAELKEAAPTLENDTCDVSWELMTLGRAVAEIAQDDSFAEDLFRFTTTLARKSGTPVCLGAVSNALVTTARIARDAGDSARARSLLAEAETITGAPSLTSGIDAFEVAAWKAILALEANDTNAAGPALQALGLIPQALLAGPNAKPGGALGAGDLVEALVILASRSELAADKPRFDAYFDWATILHDGALTAGRAHPLITKSRVLLAAGDHAGARAAIHEAAARKKKPPRADALRALGRIRLFEHRWEDARAACAEAFQADFASNARPSTKYPNLGEDSYCMALASVALGDDNDAVELLTSARNVRDLAMRLTLRRGSVSGKLRIVGMFREDLDLAMNIKAALAAGDASAARELAARVALDFGGVVIDSMLFATEKVSSRTDEDIRAELRAIRTELAVSAFERSNIDRTGITARLRELEGTLAAVGAEGRDVAPTFDVQAMTKRIPPSSALVAYVRFRSLDLNAKRPESLWGRARYSAFLIDATGVRASANLGEASVVEATISDFRKSVSDPSTVDYFDRGRAAWEVLLGKLAGVERYSRLIVLPDGAIGSVPFTALVDPSGNQLLGRQRVSYIGSARELLHPSSSAQGTTPIVLGEIDYGERPIEFIEDGRPSKLPPKFRYAHEEASGVANTLRATLISQRKATREALLQVASPNVLHIIGHAVFTNDGTPRQDPAEAMLASSLFVSDGRGGAARVSALELSSMDLRKTSLVTLSACRTGLAPEMDGLGLHGMRTALVMAGARSQMLSLWEADDARTSRLMQRFYSLVAAGTPRLEALTIAQVETRKEPLAQHPFYWASWTLSGSTEAMPLSQPDPPNRTRSCRCEIEQRSETPSYAGLLFVAAVLWRARRFGPRRTPV